MPQKLPVNVFNWVGETSQVHNKNEYAIHTRNVKHRSIID